MVEASLENVHSTADVIRVGVRLFGFIMGQLPVKLAVCLVLHSALSFISFSLFCVVDSSFPYCMMNMLLTLP